MSNEATIDEGLATLLINLAHCDMQIAHITATGADVAKLRAVHEHEQRVIAEIRGYAADYLRVRVEAAREKAAIALAKTKAPAPATEARVG